VEVITTKNGFLTTGKSCINQKLIINSIHTYYWPNSYRKCLRKSSGKSNGIVKADFDERLAASSILDIIFPFNPAVDLSGILPIMISSGTTKLSDVFLVSITN